MGGPTVEHAVLIDLLVFGALPPQAIDRHIEPHKKSINRVLSEELEPDGLVENKEMSGTYRLTDEGERRAQKLVQAGVNPYIDSKDGQ